MKIVQNIRNGRRRLTPMGEMPVLSGMLFCADCGAKLYQVRARGWTHEVKELDAEIIRALVERIDVFKPEKVPGTRTKKQTILIHWNFIGAVELPQEQKKSA